MTKRTNPEKARRECVRRRNQRIQRHATLEDIAESEHGDRYVEEVRELTIGVLEDMILLLEQLRLALAGNEELRAETSELIEKTQIEVELYRDDGGTGREGAVVAGCSPLEMDLFLDNALERLEMIMKSCRKMAMAVIRASDPQEHSGAHGELETWGRLTNFIRKIEEARTS